jgi:hypothetical protein
MAMPGTYVQARGKTSAQSTDGSFKAIERNQATGIALGGPVVGHSTYQMEAMFGDAQRHQALLNNGYVQSTALASLTDPRNRANRELWVEQAVMAAQHTPDGSGYTAMSDTTEQGETGLQGEPLVVGRARHRMNYDDRPISFRTYSMASIKRHANQNAGPFRVPFEGMDTSTNPPRTIRCEVLVARTGPGTWSAEALGVQGETAALIGEVMAARMESRRPRRGPALTGQALDRIRSESLDGKAALLARAGVRDAATGIQTSSKPHSSWVGAVGADLRTGLVVTETTRGDRYGHHVNPDIAAKYAGSTSPGTFFNAHIKGNPRMQIATCEKCSATYASSNPHACKASRIAPTEGVKTTNVIARRRAEQIAAAGEAARRAREAVTASVRARTNTPGARPPIAARRTA